MAKVSVIVPMYNVEKSLEACIESIQNQTFKDIEIICVNDGSKDSTLSIIEKIAEEDSRIKIVSQNNQGLGPARNTGMKYVTTEYIAFVDSDDTIQSTMIEKLYAAATKTGADCTYCAVKVLNSYGNTIKDDYLNGKYFKSFAGKKVLFKDVCSRLFYIPATVWNKLYKTSIIKDNNLRYQNIGHEDLPFSCEYFAKSKSFYFVNEQLYNYKMLQSNSLTSKLNCRKDIMNVYDYCGKYLRENSQFDRIADNYWSCFIDKALSLIYAFNGTIREDLYKYVREYFVAHKEIIKQELRNKNSKKFLNNIFKYEDFANFDIPMSHSFINVIRSVHQYFYHSVLTLKIREKLEHYMSF